MTLSARLNLCKAVFCSAGLLEQNRAIIASKIKNIFNRIFSPFDVK
jgi:hypothetical protein